MILSVALIVKNEEYLIVRCLDCLSSFADDIVIVDTGSTDRTKEWASKYPKVKLYDSEFFDSETHYSDFSFSVAKNEAVRKCTGDFIIWWDADDFITPETGKIIRNLASSGNSEQLFSFDIVYGEICFEHCRMFPAGKGIEFDETHSCHEFLLTQGLPVIRHREVVIQHLPGHKEVPSNVRNLAILEKDYFERNRKDIRTTFYLANAYFDCGQYVEACDFYDKYLKIGNWSEERFFARLYKARSLCRINNDLLAEKELYLAMSEDVRFAEAYCMLGDIFFNRSEIERAKKFFEMALIMSYPHDAVLFVSKSMYNDYPKSRIEDCNKKLKEVEEMKALCIKETCRFVLPVDKEEAILALFALNMVKDNNIRFEVVLNDDWQHDLLSYFPDIFKGDGPAVRFSSNRFMNLHFVDIFCRQIGVICDKIDSPNWTQVEKKHVVIWGDIDVPFVKQAVSLDNNSSFDKVYKCLSCSRFYICKDGWGQHIAKAFNIPSIILWDNKRDIDFRGWKNHNNFVNMSLFMERVEKVCKEINDGC